MGSFSFRVEVRELRSQHQIATAWNLGASVLMSSAAPDGAVSVFVIFVWFAWTYRGRAAEEKKEHAA